jgi:hypothetical protein
MRVWLETIHVEPSKFGYETRTGQPIAEVAFNYRFSIAGGKEADASPNKSARVARARLRMSGRYYDLA